MNEAQTSHVQKSRHRSVAVDGILRATNILLAGKTVVVAGYGWVGRGVASRFRGMGSIVIIVEVDPLRGLEAAMDGYQVMPIAEAARRGDLFITCTGNVNVVSAKHFPTMKDGAILANAGHFNDEIELGALEKLARSRREVRRFVEEFDLGDRKIFVLGEGRLVNHVAAEANPGHGQSFANRPSRSDLMKNAGRLAPQVYPVPRELDEEISRTKLEAMGMRIDKMTDEQAIYAKSWKAGT